MPPSPGPASFHTIHCLILPDLDCIFSINPLQTLLWNSCPVLTWKNPNLVELNCWLCLQLNTTHCWKKKQLCGLLLFYNYDWKQLGNSMIRSSCIYFSTLQTDNFTSPCTKDCLPSLFDFFQLMALPGISQSSVPSSSCCWPHTSCCPLSPLLPHGCLFPALKTNTPLVFWTPPSHTTYGLHSCSYHHFSLESSNSPLPPHFPIRALMCFNGSLKYVKSSPDSSLLPVSTLFFTYSKTYWKHLILRVFSLHPARPPSFPLHRDGLMLPSLSVISVTFVCDLSASLGKYSCP